MANILGDSNDNLLNGTVGNDTIDGGSGNDTIFAFEGDDRVLGGKGNDRLYAGTGNDTIDGGSENDYIVAGGGNDSILGGSGNDTIYGETAIYTPTNTNLIFNGSFEIINVPPATVQGYGYSTTTLPSWVLDSGPAFEVVDSGHRGVSSSDGAHWLDMDASPGNISISQVIGGVETGDTYTLSFDAANTPPSSNGMDIYWGNQLVGSVAPATLAMQSFTFNVVGGAGDGTNTLRFVGTGSADNLGLSLDNVRLFSNADTDGNHIDNIDGGSGNDIIYAGTGNDNINGGSGDDYLSGDSGNDSIIGGSSGADTLVGGAGADTMNGGSGADVFRYLNLTDSTVASHDLIKGWDVVDIINVNGLGFTGVVAGAAVGTTLGYTVSGGNTVITAATSDFSITIEGVHVLTATEFLF